MNDANSAPSLSSLLITDGLSVEKLFETALVAGTQHICQRTGFALIREVQSANCMLEKPENFLHFPISTALSPGDVGVRAEREHLVAEFRFNSSEQKTEILEGLVRAMKLKCYRETFVSDAVIVADELFTNAIYNAPYVHPVSGEAKKMSRELKVSYDGGKSGRLFLGADESRLLIGCADPFGSLDIKHFLSKIQESVVKGPGVTIDLSSGGGAGLGSFMIFSAVASLYIGVWPGKATVICGIFPYELNNRRRAQLGKHLHWLKGA